MLSLLLFSIVFYSFWRRWFGGGYKNTLIGNNRACQCVVYLLITFLLAYKVFPNISFGEDRSIIIWRILLSVIFSAYTYIQVWSRGHGACYDQGRGYPPDDSTIKRYNERWYHVPCDFICKENKYGFLYDFIYMSLRYTIPMVVLYFLSASLKLFSLEPLFSWRVILIGMFVSPVYAFCWTLYEKEKWIFQKHYSVASGTNLSEYIVGGIWGLWPLFLI